MRKRTYSGVAVVKEGQRVHLAARNGGREGERTEGGDASGGEVLQSSERVGGTAKAPQPIARGRHDRPALRARCAQLAHPLPATPHGDYTVHLHLQPPTAKHGQRAPASLLLSSSSSPFARCARPRSLRPPLLTPVGLYSLPRLDVRALSPSCPRPLVQFSRR